MTMDHRPRGPTVSQPKPQRVGPSNSAWMSIPKGVVNCPPGLECLTLLDELLVHQKVEILEVLIGLERNNKFLIINSLGQNVYYAVETTHFLSRNCWGSIRPFDMKIMDKFGNEIVHLHRPLACGSCCFPCCLQRIEVSSPPGMIIGTVEQKWSILSPKFVVKNSLGETVLRIKKGPMCPTSCCGPTVEFKIMAEDGKTQVGKISRHWSGLFREMFTDINYYGIKFPIDLDVRMKAVLLGAFFLIDVMFFEERDSMAN